MFKLKQSLIAFAGLSLLAGIFAAVTPLTGQSQTDTVGPARPVLVVNSQSEPVPVTGTVSVSNLGGAPLPVRDVDNPARQPFQANIIDIPIGLPNPVFFTVPAGKRLVIEYVSADIEADNTQCPNAPRYELTTTAGGVTLDHFFYTKDAGTLGTSVNDDTKAFGLSQQTRIYADPNTQVRLDIRTGTFPTCGFHLNEGSGIRVSGYLVDVP